MFCGVYVLSATTLNKSYWQVHKYEIAGGLQRSKTSKKLLNLQELTFINTGWLKSQFAVFETNATEQMFIYLDVKLIVFNSQKGRRNKIPKGFIPLYVVCYYSLYESKYAIEFAGHHHFKIDIIQIFIIRDQWPLVMINQLQELPINLTSAELFSTNNCIHDN